MTAEPAVLTLPTPLARLYGLAMHMDYSVQDIDMTELAAEHGPVPGDLIAVVAIGTSIRLRDTIGDDDELRAGVLAMCLSVACQMVPAEDCAEDPGDIVAQDGYVFVTDAADPDPDEAAGRIAVAIARRCGTACPAYEWWIPRLTGETGDAG